MEKRWVRVIVMLQQGQRQLRGCRVVALKISSSAGEPNMYRNAAAHNCPHFSD